MFALKGRLRDSAVARGVRVLTQLTISFTLRSEELL
jgi:hypothetical protein